MDKSAVTECLNLQVQQAQQAAVTSTAMAQEAKALGNSSMQLEQETKAEEATQAMATKAQSHVAALRHRTPQQLPCTCLNGCSSSNQQSSATCRYEL